jgi:hypothetical protein
VFYDGVELSHVAKLQGGMAELNGGRLVWRRHFRGRGMYRRFHFLCNILRISQENLQEIKEFPGFSLARDVLSKSTNQSAH